MMSAKELDTLVMPPNPELELGMDTAPDLMLDLRNINPNADSASASAPPHKMRLLVVANRLPISVKKTDKGYDFRPSSGGLVAALSGTWRDAR